MNAGGLTGMKQPTPSTTLYLQHFGLNEAPFKITPTTEFFYGGGRRGEILHALLYGIEVGEGIMAVTGEVGSGKTMMLRTLIEKLPPKVDVIFIANPSLAGREILYNICEELGLKADENRPDTVRMLQNHLIERHQQGYKVVAFIDEAQAMPDESLEEIRLLSNLETSRHKLMQIALFGQPEFKDKLAQQSMRQLRERITVSLELKPFNRVDVKEYMSTRLHAAGYNGSPAFDDEACHLIAVVSQGLSRRINVLADKAMLSAYLRSSLKVQRVDARRAVKDVKFGKMRYRSEQSKHISKKTTVWLTVAALVLIGVVIDLRFLGSDEVVPESTATATAATSVTESVAPAAVITPNNSGAAEGSTAPITVVQTVVQTVAAAAPAVSPAESRQALLSAINDLNRGGVAVDGASLAKELADNAEAHGAESPGQTPQSQGGTNEWQAAQNEGASSSGNVANNAQWDWMPASSYVRNRLNATEAWLKENGGSGVWTARLLTVRQDRAVFLEKFLRYFADFYSVRNVMVYPLRLKSGNKFVVTYGVYPTREDADVFIRNVPYYFTGGEPVAQRVRQSLDESVAFARRTQ